MDESNPPVEPIEPDVTPPAPGELEGQADIEEGNVAEGGLSRLILMTRLEMARETLDKITTKDTTIRAIPVEARVIRGFGTTKLKPPVEVDPANDTRTDAERTRDAILDSHKRGPEDPATDNLPRTWRERFTSQHRQKQVHKLRALDRERAAHTEVHGRKATIQDLTDRDLQELGITTRNLDEITFPSAAARRALEARIKQRLNDMGKIDDASEEEHLDRLYGTQPVDTIRPRTGRLQNAGTSGMRMYQRNAERGAAKEREELDHKAHKLEARLARGAAGDTFYGTLRGLKIARLQHRINRIEGRLGQELTIFGPVAEPDTPQEELPPIEAPFWNPDGMYGGLLRQAVMKEPYIDQEALDALSDEERDELSGSTKGLLLIGQYAPAGLVCSATDEERRLMAMTAELRMRAIDRSQNGFEAYDAKWINSKGDTVPVRVVGTAPKINRKDAVYIEGTRMPMLAEQIIGYRKPAAREQRRDDRTNDRTDRERERYNSGVSQEDIEYVMSLDGVSPEFVDLMRPEYLTRLDNLIANTIRDRAHEEKDARGVAKLPREEFVQLSDDVRDELIEEYIDGLIDEGEDIPAGVYEDLKYRLNIIRSLREEQERANRPRRPRR